MQLSNYPPGVTGEDDAERSYVVVEGGLVQYGSDNVDVIDLDVLEHSTMDALALEEAERYMTLMDDHGFADDHYDRARLAEFIMELRTYLEEQSV